MARGINKVILVGNVGGDPDVRHMPNGSAVTNVTIATSETWKDKQTGINQERTEWHRVVFFNRLGEIAAEYLRKGSKAYVEGSLRTRKWQGQDGQDRYTTEIVASEMQMLDNRGAPQSAPVPAQVSYAQAAPQHNPNRPKFINESVNKNENGTAQSVTVHPSSPPPGDPLHADYDDDVPFFNPYKFIEYLV